MVSLVREEATFFLAFLVGASATRPSSGETFPAFRLLYRLTACGVCLFRLWVHHFQLSMWGAFLRILRGGFWRIIRNKEVHNCLIVVDFSLFSGWVVVDKILIFLYQVINWLLANLTLGCEIVYRMWIIHLLNPSQIDYTFTNALIQLIFVGVLWDGWV